MWQIVHSSYRGRAILAINRIVILLLSSSLIVILMFGSRIWLSGKIFGSGIHLNDPVQSIPRFQFIPAKMTFDSFIIEYLGIRIAALFLVGLVLWLLLSTAKNISIAAAITSLLLAGQYALFSLIADSSVLVPVRYINVFSFIEIGKIYEIYLNISLFGVLLSAKSLVISLIPILICIFSFCCVWYVPKKYPVAGMSFPERLLDKLRAKINPVFGKMRLPVMESYKILFSLKGIIIIIALIWSVANYNGVQIPEMESKDFHALEYYEKYSGEVTAEKIKQLHSAFDTATRQASEYTGADMGDYFKSRISAIEMVLDDAQRIHEINISQGKNFQLIEPYAYLSLLSSDSEDYHRKRGVEISLLIILLLAGLFAYENEKRVKELILSTPNGRRKLVRVKIIQGIKFLLIFFIVFYGTEIISASQIFNGLSFLNAPAQSLQFLGSLPYKMTLLELVVMVYVLKLLTLIVLFMLLSVLSAIIRKVSDAIIAGITLFIVPSVMVLLGYDSIEKLTFIYPFGLKSIFEGSILWIILLYVAVIIPLCWILLEKAFFSKINVKHLN